MLNILKFGFSILILRQKCIERFLQKVGTTGMGDLGFLPEFRFFFFFYFCGKNRNRGREEDSRLISSLKVFFSLPVPIPGISSARLQVMRPLM